MKLSQGIAGVLCSVNEAPFCCSQSLYFVDQSHLRLKQRKKAVARAVAGAGARGRGRGRGRGGGVGSRGRRAAAAAASARSEEDGEDDEDEDDSDDDEQYLYFEDGYSADLGMYRDLQVLIIPRACCAFGECAVI